MIAVLDDFKSVWHGEEIPKLREWWPQKNVSYIYGNLSRHMAKCCRIPDFAALITDVRCTLCRFQVGGWLASKIDFELSLSSSEHAEFEDNGESY